MCFIKELNFNILWNVLNGFIYIQRPKQSFQTFSSWTACYVNESYIAYCVDYMCL